MDFWIGDWQVHWRRGDGTEGDGRDTVDVVAGGCALVERYADITTAFSGQGQLSWNRYAKRWDMFWTDNTGMSFTARGEGVGKTIVFDLSTAVPRMRIVFDAITSDSFEWRFESSQEGQSWRALTTSRYQRKQ